jgi:hypothetical protein
MARFFTAQASQWLLIADLALAGRAVFCTLLFPSLLNRESHGQCTPGCKPLQAAASLADAEVAVPCKRGKSC